MTALTDEILNELAEGDDMLEFECPRCRGSFFSAWAKSDGNVTQGVYECTTAWDPAVDVVRARLANEQLPSCKWKGPAAECMKPSRAALATEILRLRTPLRDLLEVCDEQDERGEPVIGHDSNGAISYLLEFSDKIRPMVRKP